MEKEFFCDANSKWKSEADLLQELNSKLHQKFVEKKKAKYANIMLSDFSYKKGKKMQSDLKTTIEDRITMIIRAETEAIRACSEKIQWSDFQYQKRIKPEIPRLTAETFEGDDE